MGARSDRNSVIIAFLEDLLSKDGLKLYEKWFEHLQQLTPGEKVLDTAVRDEMLQEIIRLVSVGNSLILGKMDKMMVEEILNKFLKGVCLLNADKTL